MPAAPSRSPIRSGPSESGASVEAHFGAENGHRSDVVGHVINVTLQEALTGGERASESWQDRYEGRLGELLVGAPRKQLRKLAAGSQHGQSEFVPGLWPGLERGQPGGSAARGAWGP